MITNRDLAVIPVDAGRLPTETDTALAEAWDQFAARLADRSLDRVQRVILRLLSRASAADPESRHVLLADVDELEYALRAARDVIFPTSGLHDHAPIAALAAGWGSVIADRSRTPSGDAVAPGRGVALAHRMARAAGELAATEERIAEVFEHTAGRRPAAAHELRATAERARRFARHELAAQQFYAPTA